MPLSLANMTSIERWEEVAKVAAQHVGQSVDEIATALQKRFGEIGEIIGGDELYPNDTTWYFTMPATE
jgi:hypothetical protein